MDNTYYLTASESQLIYETSLFEQSKNCIDLIPKHDYSCKKNIFRKKAVFK